MTKVTILGQEPKEVKKLKPIEFTDFLSQDKKFIEDSLDANIWVNIELVARYSAFDIMFAYDDDRNKGCLYIGHFNDGVVE